MGVLRAWRQISCLVYHVGLGKTPFDVADMTMDLCNDVAPRIIDAGLRTFVVDDWCAGPHGLFGIEDGRKHFVVDLQGAAACLGSAFALANDDCHALANKAYDAVEYGRIVRGDG